MSKYLKGAIVAVLAALLVFGMTGCPTAAGGPGAPPPLAVGGPGNGKTALSTPENLEINDEFVLTWDAVDHAATYTVLVNGNSGNQAINNLITPSLDLKTVGSLALTLVPHRHSVMVKAVVPASHETYNESGYSDPVDFETAQYVFEIDEHGTITGLTTYGGTLENIVIPEYITDTDSNEPITVEEIGAGAFDTATSMTKVEIPRTVKKIKSGAFTGATSLDTVEFHRTQADGDPIELEGTIEQAFGSNADDLNVYVPEGEEDTYGNDLGFDVTVPEVTGVELYDTDDNLLTSADDIAMSVGGSPVTLVKKVIPDTATNQNVTWSTSNGNVATVANGVVTAQGPGTATITVTTAEGGKTASCTVTVTQPITNITLANQETPLVIYMGDSVAVLVATIVPANATNQDVTWESSNEAVATVTQTGRVTALSVGTTTITVTSDNQPEKNASRTVAVRRHVTGVSLSTTALTLAVGGTPATLVATVAPSDAFDQAVSWSTSNADVATVLNGTVTAVARGTATITVTTADGGKTATCAVTVTQPVLGVAIGNKVGLTGDVIRVGDTVTISAAITPANANNQAATWSVDPVGAITFANANALSTSFTAVTKGAVTLTVTSADGGFTDTVTFTILPQIGEATVDHLYLQDADMEDGAVANYNLFNGETKVITVPAGFTASMWSVNGVFAQGGGNSFTFDTQGLTEGQYRITLVAEKGGVPFSMNVIVHVVIKGGAKITPHYISAEDLTAQLTGETTLSKGDGDILVIAAAAGFTPTSWSVDGAPAQAGGDTFTFDSSDKTVGKRYTITLVAEKDGVPYNTNVAVTVTE